MSGQTSLDADADADHAKTHPGDEFDDYVLAQARTLGDFQGEGECPTRAELP